VGSEHIESGADHTVPTGLVTFLDPLQAINCLANVLDEAGPANPDELAGGPIEGEQESTPA
jgi:hypothetical protein